MRVVLVPLLLLAGCAREAPKTSQTMAVNPVGYFEIPARDLDRAVKFYAAVFGFAFERQRIDGHDMALFPIAPDRPGASGALVTGEPYAPAQTGSLVYFSTSDIAAALRRVEANGGRTLYPLTSIGANGFVAEFEDSEGNRVALHMAVR